MARLASPPVHRAGFHGRLPNSAPPDQPRFAHPRRSSSSRSPSHRIPHRLQFRFVERPQPQALIKIEGPRQGCFRGFKIPELAFVARQHEVENPFALHNGFRFQQRRFRFRNASGMPDRVRRSQMKRSKARVVPKNALANNRRRLPFSRLL
jgi:hypothetical protein